jgi:hypothetical protein
MQLHALHGAVRRGQGPRLPEERLSAACAAAQQLSAASMRPQPVGPRLPEERLSAGKCAAQLPRS